MQDEPTRNREGLTPAERELELALARLRPSPAKLDRDRLIFEAGRLAERRRSRRWMALAASLGLCALLAVIITPGIRVRERIVYRDHPGQAAGRSDTLVATPAAAPGPAAEGVPYMDVRAAMAAEGDIDLASVKVEPRKAEEPRLQTLFFGLFAEPTTQSSQGR